MSSRHSAKLGEYRSKRDFRRTPEPAARAPRKGAADRARFVVQEHRARRLHWDLRLEHDGALLSWALPSGVPQDPSENRLAVHVEDHPLSYLDFEGEIPAGSYGAGRVAIWDHGTYECEKLEPDKVVVVLHGERLHGRYALFRTRDRDWMIHRMDPPEVRREPMPERLQPMLATPGTLPRDDSEWAFEVKWDGVRALAYWRPAHLRLESRNLKDVSSRYPELRALGTELGAREAVLDGEVVAFDEHGKPSFGRLQRRMHLSSESAIRRLAREEPVTYMIFDLLYLDGHVTLGLPYRERRQLLEGLGLRGSSWQTPAYHVGEGAELLAATAEQGLEGVLAKRLDSPYLPGQRPRTWLKIKNTRRQELVIGGWLPGKGRRSEQIGALLMGYYDTGRGRPSLRYVGRVGTGFDEQELAHLGEQLRSRARASSPFAASGVQPPRESLFVEPELVAEIEFSAWTREQILRHSSYKGLRFDKPAADVVLESAATKKTKRRPSVRSSSGGANSSGSHRARPRHTREARPESVRAERTAARAGSSPPPYEVVRETKTHTEIEVDGRVLRLSNRDKVLYPQVPLTKGQVIDFYAAAAPALLPHLAGRPLTLKRYPDGVQAQHFYQKRCPAHRPDWVATAPVWSERLKEPVDYCLVEDLPTLIWVANLAGIELHTSLSRRRDRHPDDAGVRPRSGRAGGRARVREGRPMGARAAADSRSAHVREDVRVQGPAGLCAAQHSRLI